MPYKVFGNCVHKLNSDGSKGKLVHCHESHDKAVAQLRALYASEEKTMKKEKREKRREQRLRSAQIAKQRAEELEQELILEPDLIADEDFEKEPEVAEKDMYGAEMSMMGVGPTSWEQLDELKDAQERNEEIQEAAYSVESLVRNIIYNPMFSVEEKANAVKAVGDGFGARVQKIMDSPVEKEFDMELLELEAMIAKDNRSMSVIEKTGAFVNKAIMDSEDLSDKSHVRNAMTHTAQMIKRGGAEAEEYRKMLPKIHEAAKKFGIGMNSGNGILVEKDASGSWRWVGWPTNNFKDRSGDIITEAAQKDYVNWINEDIEKNAPMFTSCHAPGTVRENPVDFAAYENGFVVMSGRLTEPEAAALLKMSSKCDIGMSHTGWAWRDSDNPEQIIKYRSFEVTDLPVEAADNPFTLLEISKEATVDQLQYLTDLLGSKEKAESALKLKTSMKQKELQDAGVESKENKPETPPPTETPVPAAASVTLNTDQIVAQVLKELDVEGLQDFVAKAQGAMEKVPVLEELVKSLSTSKEDDLAQMINPPAEKRFAWSKARASESKENIVKDGDDIKKNLAGLPEDWLSEALGTSPISQ